MNKKFSFQYFLIKITSLKWFVYVFSLILFLCGKITKEDLVMITLAYLGINTANKVIRLFEK